MLRRGIAERTTRASSTESHLLPPRVCERSVMSTAVFANLECATLEPLVRKLEYWHPLDDEDRAAVLALPHTVRTLERNHYVVREFDRPQHCCVMLKGFATRQKVVIGGLRQICAIHRK